MNNLHTEYRNYIITKDKWGSFHTASPLTFFFPDRATPELQRLHAELGSRHSFREAARLIQSFPPCDPRHHMTGRRRLGRISEKLEQTRSTSGDLADTIPKGGLTMFLDGANTSTLPDAVHLSRE